jgi:hypothetical protein
MGRYIKRPFRTENGHDSIEDARAALDLAKYAMHKPVHQIGKKAEIPSLFLALKPKVFQIRVFGDEKDVMYGGVDEQVKCCVSQNPCDDFIHAVLEERPPVSVLHLGNLARNEGESEEAICRMYNDCLKMAKECAPTGSLIVVYGGGKGRKQSPAKDTEFGRGLCWVFGKNEEA